jgi:hypothetical protein
MAMFPVSFDALIEYIRGLQPEGGPLDHLADAVIAAGQLDDQSDAIIGYFVDQARASGASWSQIGSAMGVSKQAAQKRFVVREDEGAADGRTFSRFTPRARASMAAAGRMATAAGSDAVDVSHLAAGSLVDPEGLAARAVDRLEVSVDRIYSVLGVGPATDAARPEPAALRQLQFTPEGREALKEAWKAALRLEHNYIGTEHLLLGAVAGQGHVAVQLAALDLKPSVIESAIAVELAEAQLRMRRQAR